MIFEESFPDRRNSTPHSPKQTCPVQKKVQAGPKEEKDRSFPLKGCCWQARGSRDENAVKQ